MWRAGALAPLRRAVRPAVRAVAEGWDTDRSAQSRRGLKRLKRQQKERQASGAGAGPRQAPAVVDADLGPGGLDGLLERLEGSAQLALAVSAATELGAEPATVLMSRPLKPLRAALGPFAELYRDERAGGAAAAASSALADGREADALEALRRLGVAGHAPRLGSIQRWVRDCMNFGGNAALQTPQAVALLDAIIRLQPVRWWWQDGAAEEAARGSAGGEGVSEAHGGSDVLVLRHPPFEATPRVEPLLLEALSGTSPAGPSSATPAEDPSGREGGGYRGRFGTQAREARCGALAAQFPASLYEVVYHEAASDRKPRNRYDLDIFALRCPSAIRFEASQDALGVQGRRDVPGVPGAFVVTGVLSLHECEHIIAAAEASPTAYVPDEPVSTAPAPDGFSSRAFSFVWLAEAVARRLYERSKPHLPATLPAGGGHGEEASLSGLNARLRLYRYHPGALYRPHVDGAWPASALRRGPGGEPEYVYDAVSDQRSRLTFLVYLNDDFEGGYTTFYTPGPMAGRLEARRIAPRTGSVLVFPHGGDCGSLVHEGSTVERGAKYVIRTDVLYANGGATLKVGGTEKGDTSI